ncbi:hypothetical protein GFS31_31570 [Leptolyngbya sp. BL0902]|nr:hypothetical protein GFS31_31570 [Leptolyngbya sp. BL0902]
MICHMTCILWPIVACIDCNLFNRFMAPWEGPNSPEDLTLTR